MRTIAPRSLPMRRAAYVTFSPMPSEPKEVWGDLPTSAFVQSSHLFKSLDPEAMEDLLKLARAVRFAPAEVIVREGDKGEDFFLIQEGTAGVYAVKKNKQIELGHL